MRKRSLTERWYRAPIASGLAKDSQVDHEAGVLRGFVVIEEGEATGHGEEIDETTLRAIVELGNAPTHGVKMRFGHPGMSDDALGSFAGHATGFRLDDASVVGRVLADATFSESAKANPSNMVERILLRAKNEPHSFGNSVVIKRDLEFRIDSKGERLKDDDGDPLSPLVRPLALLASDLVDSPAATSALFSSDDLAGTGAELSAGVTEALDDILSRPDADQRMAAFFERFASSHPDAAARIAVIAEGYNRQETPMDPETEKSEDEKSVLSRIRAVLGLGGEPAAGPLKGVPEPPPRPLLPVIDVDATMPAVKPAGSTEMAELRDELKELKATIEKDQARQLAERAVSDEAAKAMFKVRVEAQVTLGKLTASGAKAIMARGMSLLLAGADPSEAIEAFEAGPSPDDVVGLRQPLTFVVPIPGEDDLPVDLSGYGVRKAPGGSFAPADPEAAKALATKVGDKTGAELVEALKNEYMEGVA